MDFVKNLTGGNQNQNQNTATNQQQPTEGQKEEGGFLAGLANKAHGAAGGGPESEKNEDALDKGTLQSWHRQTHWHLLDQRDSILTH